MEKLTIDISPKEWGTLITKYNANSKRVTLADFTDGTVNVATDITGSVTKRPGGPNYNPSLLPAATKDQFEAIFSDGAHHLLVVANGEIRYSSGDTIFNTVVNGTGYSAGANFEFATTQDRVYGGNAVNAPIVYDRTTSYGGVTYTAPRIRPMGAQAPGTAPVAPGAGAAGGAVPAGPHTYKVTFLYYDFEESNGSPASGVCTVVVPNQTVNLTSIPIGGYGVTARKIYRDNSDGLYLHVGTITDNTATIFADTVAVGVTPTEIPEFNNAPPSFGSVVLWLDKLWVAKVPGDPTTLFYSETSMPDIFRPESQLLCNQEDPITAYAVYFGRLIVFNRRSMGQILGTTPDTFRYSAIPSSIGCVDNRTLQVRVIEGVPILIWLSDRGFYSYDGNAINYISDEIEDLVNFNIQQAVQQKNSNTQSSQTQFQSGVSSQGIDLLSIPGSITTKGYQDGTPLAGTNPRRNFDDNTDWNAGTQVINVQNRRVDNLLSAIPRQNYLNSFPGTKTGDLVPGTGNLMLTTTANHTGISSLTGSTIPRESDPAARYTGYAQSFIVPRAGQMTSFTVGVTYGFQNFLPVVSTYRVRVYRDDGNKPGLVAFDSGVITGTNPVTPILHVDTFAIAINCAVNEKLWIGMETLGDPSHQSIFARGAFAGSFPLTPTKKLINGAWVTGNANNLYSAYVFSPTLIPKSGQYTSTSYDSISDVITTMTISQFGTFLNNFGTKSHTLELQASTDNLSFTTIFTSASRSTFSSGAITVGAARRYFRFKITMSTTDDRETDTITELRETFLNNVEWISAAIDTTADSTVYNSLTTTASVPSGTTIQTLIATSANDITYTSYVAFGSHVVQRYAKIKIIFTKNSLDSLSPTLSFLILKWTIVANLVSSGIDTGVTPPAGWDVFLSAFNTNGGTVVFQMRSATTLGGLTAATFFTITPNDFPTAVTPLQFVQWKVIITSADNDVPTIDSVTVQWLISNVASIRPASIFADSQYYVALAEFDQLTNNILLELDSDGKWRRHKGLNISTFSFFFNRPYYGLATTGQIRKFLEGFTDAGIAIEFDMRTKAFDFSTQYQNNSSKVKNVGEVILQGINTGATIQLFYSIDLGETFSPMYTSDGLASYVTTSDGSDFHVRFRPLWDGSSEFKGRSIMYRIYSNDLHEVEIKALEVNAFARKQAPVITG